MCNNQLYFPNGFEKAKVRWEKIKIKLAPNFNRRTNVAMEHNVLAMSSSELTHEDYRMRRNLINNNNLRIQHLTAITYSLCCTSVKKDGYART